MSDKLPDPPLGSSGLPNLGTVDAEGTATRNTETSARSVPPSLGVGRPTLTVLTGFAAGFIVTIANEMMIGRAANCGLELSDPGVSRAHARITLRGDEVLLFDLGAKNGTFVDERVIPAEGLVLHPQDVIHLGPHVSVRFAFMTRAEEKLARDLYESSMRDPLTRSYNRRYLASRLKAEVAYVQRHGTPLSVLAFDFDHFKQLNDRHGHSAGDDVLRGGAAVVVATLRSEDVLARIGGEEFLVVLRGIAGEAASICAERIRSAVENAEFSADGRIVRATISVGASSSDEVTLDDTGTTLIKLADKRLYEAKSAGRNRVVGSVPIKKAP